MAFQYDLGFVGAGNMAEAIAAAVVGRKLYAPGQIIASDPVPERRELMARQFGVAVTEDSRQVVAQSRRVVWAVKPQQFAEVAAGVAEAASADQLHISIMAGLSARKIAAVFSAVQARVVRVMPNLPLRVGAGMAGLCRGEHAAEQDLAETRAIFDAGGGTVVVDDESLIDAVTAVAGSGPAYFYYFVEAMVAGGVECGLSDADALKLAEYTCLGAARMMLETGEPPAELRRKVSSKGGTTQAALEHMRIAGVDKGIREAVRAAFTRARKLGQAVEVR
ncbi:MAG TPA: pyrroline-5-carboxylate reductase [Phycisphaerae bacterium]|nr:pyrroline-5-carboxylate reductase [Phycisphaerae bacterium]